MHRDHLIAIAAAIALLDVSMIGAHFIIYSHSMSFMPGGYIADIPGFSWLFAESEAQVSHVVAAVTAVASVVTPVAGFYYVAKERIVPESGAYFSFVPNRVTFGVLATFWLIMIGLEIVNVMVLVDLYFDDPLRRQDGIFGALEHSKSLSLLFAIVVTAVNQAIGLFSALIYTKAFSKEVLS